MIYDIGGGKNCRYIDDIKNKNVSVFALDISGEELLPNSRVSGKIVSDVCEAVPTPHGKVDMITSSSVLEHLLKPEDFFINAYQSLKPGGYFIHVCPCRYALFAIMNRILPQKLSRSILFFFLSAFLVELFMGLGGKKIEEKKSGFVYTVCRQKTNERRT